MFPLMQKRAFAILKFWILTTYLQIDKIPITRNNINQKIIVDTALRNIQMRQRREIREMFQVSWMYVRILKIHVVYIFQICETFESLFIYSETFQGQGLEIRES